MENELLIYGIQTVTAIIFVGMGFILKGLFTRLDNTELRINKLEVAMARNAAENETLFKRLDGIESKLDRLLENWNRAK